MKRIQDATNKGYNQSKFFDDIIRECDKAWEKFPYNGTYTFVIPDTDVKIERTNYNYRHQCW